MEISLVDIPEEHLARLEGFASEPLFQTTFSGLPVSFAMVEVDKIIAS